MRQLRFFLVIFIFHTSNVILAETSINSNSSVTELYDGFTLTIRTVMGLYPDYVQTLEEAEKTLNESGFDIHTVVPSDRAENVISVRDPAEPLDFGDLLIERNTAVFLENNAKLAYLKSLKNVTPDQRSAFTELYEKTLKAKWNLEELKRRDPVKFNSTLDKIKLQVDQKCTVSAKGMSSGCGSSGSHLLSEAFKKGGQGKRSIFKGVIVKSDVFEDYLDDLKLQRLSELEKARLGINRANSSQTSSSDLCTLDALKFYRKNIINVPKSFPFHHHIIGGSGSKFGKKTSCQLVELSFDVQETPFKRILVSGSITNKEGVTILLDQAKFDQVLRSWNIIPWNENSKILNKTDNLIHTQRNKFKPLPESQTKPDDGDGVR